MIYAIETSILAEKSKILVKEKNQKYFTYKSVKKIEKLLTEKKELYSIGYDLALNKILKIEFVGLQDFYKVETFSGSKLIIGVDCEIYIDGEWVRVEEVLYHEKIFQYDLLDNVFRKTIITKIGSYANLKAYNITIERSAGIVVNNLIVRFESEKEEDESYSHNSDQIL